MSTALQDPDEAARASRKAHREAQLLLAAARLMEREGSEAVSMQALAAEAGVSVGLIYRYFASKDDLLLAVITQVLDAFSVRVPEAVAAAGDDPVHGLVAAFRAYCEVVDEHRHAAVLTYRESRSLSDAGRERIKAQEVATIEPLTAVIEEGVLAGVFAVDDAELVAYNIVLTAHAWVLKHWYFQRRMTLQQYVDRQSTLTLRAILSPAGRRRYRRLLTG